MVFEEKSPSLCAEERGSLAIDIVNRALQRLSTSRTGCNGSEGTKTNGAAVTSRPTPGADVRHRDVPSNRLTTASTTTKASSRITVAPKEEEIDQTLAIIECASAAFRYLRKDQTATSASEKVDYKLEHALTAFVGQLLVLQYISHAVSMPWLFSHVPLLFPSTLPALPFPAHPMPQEVSCTTTSRVDCTLLVPSEGAQVTTTVLLSNITVLEAVDGASTAALILGYDSKGACREYE